MIDAKGGRLFRPHVALAGVLVSDRLGRVHAQGHAQIITGGCQAPCSSCVVEREGKLVALVFPDQQGEINFRQPLAELMMENLQKLNNLLPKYSQVTKVELQEKEFEKTPKKSIKRFLYQ